MQLYSQEYKYVWLRSVLFDWWCMICRWCERRGWHSSHLLLALPQVYKQKANVATHTYQGPLRQNAISRWIRQKLHQKIETIQNFGKFRDEWLTFQNGWQESEVRVLLFTDQDSIPMFFSALSVKFPGRVKFGVVNEDNGSAHEWTQTLLPDTNFSLPLYLIITSEGAYVYGKNQGDCLTFFSMETLLKFLHPCLNDIFIFSFLVANLVSGLELIIVQGSLGQRLRRFLWCVVKYNSAVIMLWLPLIAMFQLPYLDHLPLLGLKLSRLLATSPLGEAFRRDIFFYSQHPYILASSFLFAGIVFGVIAYKVTGGRYEEDNEPWFNFAQMRTLTHLRSNEFFEPMFMSGYSGGMEIFGSRLNLPSLSLEPVISPHYISLLPTWQYCSTLRSSDDCCHSCSCDHCNEDSDGKVTENSGSPGGMDSSGQFPCSCPLDHRSSGQGYSCIASADDLLDGNYHCECEEHARLHNLSVPVPTHSPSISNYAASRECFLPPHSGSSVASSDSIRCTKCSQWLQKQSFTSIGTATSNGTITTTQISGCELESSFGCSPESQTSSADCVDFPEGYLACSHCVICLEEYSTGVTLCGLPCSHVFHHSCILTWLKRDHHFCPVCRWPSFRPRPQLVHAHAEWWMAVSNTEKSVDHLLCIPNLHFFWG